MKTINRMIIWAALSLALVAVGTTGTTAQLIPLPEFTGSFTLPVRAQWGAMALPAGHYNLYYGAPFKGGSYAVEVVNSADGSARGMILVRDRTSASSSRTELVCTREGNVDIVRALNVPALGESIHFSLPRNMELMANQQNHKANTKVAALRGLPRFVPVTLNR